MARLECKCGHVMWNGETPNDIEYFVFSDITMDKILSADCVSTIELANKADYNVWCCPECRRLYVFCGSEREPKYVYSPE